MELMEGQGCWRQASDLVPTGIDVSAVLRKLCIGAWIVCELSDLKYVQTSRKVRGPISRGCRRAGARSDAALDAAETSQNMVH